jgi:hypothetical protein
MKRFSILWLLSMSVLLASCGREPSQEVGLESAATWTKIADEYKSFTLAGTHTVRYGTDSRWVEKTVTDSGECSNAFFGRDPAKSILKRCEVLALGPSAPVPGGETVTVSYQKDDSNFLNPERGFAMPQISYSNNPRPLEVAKLEASKAQGISVINRRYALVNFRNSAISQDFLRHIQRDLDLVREHGMKMVIRFCYTFNEDGSHEDASLSRMLEHVAQLKPVLQKNVDVIAYLEAGFIGRWGEWNKSSHGLGDETNPQNVEAQKQLVDALLEAVPAERMITLRYLSRKKAIISDSPLSSDNAYTGSAQARVGHMNDYFTIDNWSGSDKDYLQTDTLYTVQGGESIKLNGSRSECPAVMGELTTFHWSTMNSPGSDFADVWREGGCYNEIAKRLGYRYMLEQATLPKTVAPGGTLRVELDMSNEGFANLYNPRALEFVLRHGPSGDETHLGVELDKDIRAFLPPAGETKTLTLSTDIPAGLLAGDYELFLNLPDASDTLKNRAAYSVRLANVGVWESSTGYNRLGKIVMN